VSIARIACGAVSAVLMAATVSIVTLATAPTAQAAPFSGDNVVVVRVGDGSAVTSGAAAPVFLDEFTPAGALVQSVAMPTSVSGDQRRLVLTTSATSEGALNLSADGNYLTLGGYDAAPATAAVPGTPAATVNRVVGRVDGSGVVDTSTALTDAFSGVNIRGVVTDDGTRFWATGNSGIRHAAVLGATTSTSLSATNSRVPAVAGGQLYFSTGSAPAGVYSLGTGLPTSGAQSAALLAARNSPYGLSLLDRDPGVAGVDTLYVADDSALASGGGIYKYSFDGSSWTARGFVALAGARGLTAQVSGANAVVYATTGPTLVSLTDTAAFNVDITGSPTTIRSAGTNTVLRGVAFAPSGGPVTTAPSIGTHPQSQNITEGDTATLTVVASGTSPLSYQWYQGVAPDTSTPVGTNSSSFTTPALTETTSWWVRVTNSAGAADSQTATVTVSTAPTPCVDPATPIGSIQGTGAATPVPNTTVVVRGVVVGDNEGLAPALGGFYLQDTGDSNAATSDGIFVFDRGVAGASVAAGDRVEVTGTALEFQGQTQVTATSVDACGTGDVAPTDVSLPQASADALEPYEGMLVRFAQELTVTEHFLLGRFGEVLVSSGGRLRQPTSIYPAADPQSAALQAANNLNQLIVDDALNNQNADPIVFGRGGSPLTAANTLRGGDTLTNPVGVMTYGWAGNAASPNAYRLRPVNALHGSATFVAANQRPTTAPAVGGDVQVTSANLLNYFNTFGNNCSFGVGGGVAECRGAENTNEFERQAAKEVAALLATDAEVIGLMEMENDGYGPTSAIQDLVNRLNAATAPGTWAFIDADAVLGGTNVLGTDAIKVGMLYKPASVTPVAGHTFTTSGVFERNPLIQEFETSTGARVTVVVNHFKSKGCGGETGADVDQGDGQGCFNFRRTTQAQALAAYIANTVVPATGDEDILIIGDLNAYAQEDPILALLGSGYTNLVLAHGGVNAYSYVFDGQWGYLDHALASPSLVAQVTGAADFHINADEPSVLDYNTNFKSVAQQASLYAPDMYRTSDHDSVLIGLGLDVPDTTEPAITWVGSIDDGDSFGFGSVPPEPTCTAVDAVDGSVPCEVTGYSTAVGPHTLTAKASDAAGNTATETRSYTVTGYSLFGFYAPVQMGGVLNPIKAGSTAPLKYEVFLGSTELMSTSVVASTTSTPISCTTLEPTGAPSTSGFRGVRYLNGLFTDSWKSPKQKGSCYRVTMTTVDGSSLVANFRLT